MACTDIFDAMHTATESLDQNLIVTANAQDVWANLVPMGTYKKNSGVTQSVFTIENTEPVTDDETWTTATLTDNLLAPNCAMSYTEVEVGVTINTFSPEEFGLKGPVICRDTLTYQHEPERFLNEYEQKLANRAMRTTSLWKRKKYIALAKKFVTDSGLTSSTTTSLPASAADSELTQDYLDEVYSDIIENTDLPDPDTSGFVSYNNGLLLSLLIDQRDSQRLMRNDSDLRADIRESNTLLMNRIGSQFALKNFRHIPVVHVPRYDFTGGAYVQRPTWEMVATTEGKKAQLTNAYKAAEFKAAIVAVPTVYTAEAVLPTSWKFPDATNYYGEWDFVTGAYKWDTDCVDPQHDRGRHFAKFRMAARPNKTQHGAVIIYQVCDDSITRSTCS